MGNGSRRSATASAAASVPRPVGWAGWRTWGLGTSEGPAEGSAAERGRCGRVRRRRGRRAHGRRSVVTYDDRQGALARRAARGVVRGTRDAAAYVGVRVGSREGRHHDVQDRPEGGEKPGRGTIARTWRRRPLGRKVGPAGAVVPRAISIHGDGREAQHEEDGQQADEPTAMLRNNSGHPDLLSPSRRRATRRPPWTRARPPPLRRMREP